MAVLSFLVHLTGATMLLLYAVRMVRTGIERSFGASFQRILTQQNSAVSASLAGVGLAIILQSSAAVALLVSGFTALNSLSFASGLAIVLGADLGSALIIQALSFKLDWLVPLLLAVGGWLFIKFDTKRIRQMGRIFIGIAFILISLRFLREAMEPIRESDFLPAIALYLASDYITAFLVGAALAFIMHSSVATVLMCVTLVAINAIPVTAGISLVLGANLGSALIPVWLTRNMEAKAKRVPKANLILRGIGAIMALFAINQFDLLSLYPLGSPQQSLISAHIIFNASVLILTLILFKPIVSGLGAIFPEPTEQILSPDKPISALDATVIDRPQLAQASLKREILQMSSVVQRMAAPVMTLFETGTSEQITEIQKLDLQVNEGLNNIRSYVSSMSFSTQSKEDAKRTLLLMEYAIALEAAGDIIAKRILPLVRSKQKKMCQFSHNGWNELVGMHESVMANLALASNVLISDDVECARDLVVEKTEIQRYERNSIKNHFKRLAEGQGVNASLETSDIHLETLRALRDFNSRISIVAYPILYRNGQLHETRLIDLLDN